MYVLKPLVKKNSTFGTPSPANHPPVQAAWKLKPPVRASMSSTSPARKRPGMRLLSKRRKSTSWRATPPAVTNSSLKVLLPLTGRRHSLSCETRAFNWALLRSAQFFFASIHFQLPFHCFKTFSISEYVPT